MMCSAIAQGRILDEDPTINPPRCKTECEIIAESGVDDYGVAITAYNTQFNETDALACCKDLKVDECCKITYCNGPADPRNCGRCRDGQEDTDLGSGYDPCCESFFHECCLMRGYEGVDLCLRDFEERDEK